LRVFYSPWVRETPPTIKKMMAMTEVAKFMRMRYRLELLGPHIESIFAGGRGRRKEAGQLVGATLWLSRA
jgi:hypothetical protein